MYSNTIMCIFAEGRKESSGDNLSVKYLYSAIILGVCTPTEEMHKLTSMTRNLT